MYTACDICSIIVFGPPFMVALRLWAFLSLWDTFSLWAIINLQS